jgi:ubiquitin carboxyl-terminal hydrolase 8
MSAAAPGPPPGSLSTRALAMSGYTNGAFNGSPDPHGAGSAGGAGGAGARNPPIAEIVGSATEKVEAMRNHSV